MKTLALIFVFLTSPVIAADTYSPDDHWGPIRILSQKDIEAIPENSRFSYLAREFGRPFDTTIAVLVYPKKSDKVKYTKENSEQIWNCGFWFFPKTNGTGDNDPQIAYIASLKSTEHGSEQTIDWPKSLKGKKLQEILKTEQAHSANSASLRGR
jgi:hypothetical protein